MLKLDQVNCLKCHSKTWIERHSQSKLPKIPSFQIPLVPFSSILWRCRHHVLFHGFAEGTKAAPQVVRRNGFENREVGRVARIKLEWDCTCDPLHVQM